MYEKLSSAPIWSPLLLPTCLHHMTNCKHLLLVPSKALYITTFLIPI